MIITFFTQLVKIFVFIYKYLVVPLINGLIVCWEYLLKCLESIFTIIAQTFKFILNVIIWIFIRIWNMIKYMGRILELVLKKILKIINIIYENIIKAFFIWAYANYIKPLS